MALDLATVASKPLKPFQGLKLFLAPRQDKYAKSFKASKTLSGIETKAEEEAFTLKQRFKASKTLSGIETRSWQIQAWAKLQLQSL